MSKPTKTAVQQWTERNLTAEVEALKPAYCVDEILRRVCDVLDAGKHPVLVGESGIGKTAAVHELVRRLRRESISQPLAGRDVLQISVLRRRSQLSNPQLLGKSMQELVDELANLTQQPALFFRDLHCAFALSLDSQMEQLALQLRAPLLGEADASAWESSLEDTPELEQHFVAIHMREPSIETMEELVESWRTSDSGRASRFSKEGAAEALRLCDRFLGRARHPRKTVDFLYQVEAIVPGERPVLREQVIDRFQQNTGVPRFLIDPAVPFDVAATERAFLDQVLGQREAVRAVVQVISLIKAGLSDARRAFGALFFAGPTGVGKTHLAQLLAEYLFGSRERVVRFNMADFQNPDDALTVFGDPNRYDSASKRGLLTKRLLGHPFAVLLLDEFEKAHPRTHDRFLQLIDEGAFINGQGERISCRSLIIILTSNAGAEVYRERALGFSDRSSVQELELDRELDRRLFACFRHEFLNRFDHIVHFHPLSRSAIRTVAQREIEALAKRAGIRFNELALHIDEDVLDWLAVHGYDAHFGARYLKRCIERNVTIALAEAIVAGPVAAGSRLDVSVRGDRVVAQLRTHEVEERQIVNLPRAAGSVRKTLGPDALRKEAGALIERTKTALAALEGDQQRASALLEQISRPGLWEDAAAGSVQLLAEYRRLDVLNGLGARVRAAQAQVEQLLSSRRDGEDLQRRLADALERAAQQLEEWQRRRDEAGPSEIWLLMHNADPLHPVSDWLAELCEMELAWCRRLQLDAELVAYGERDGVLSRVVLLASGAGAARFLEMERGLHRRPPDVGHHDQRVRMHVFAASDGVSERAVSMLRRRRGQLGLEVACGASVERGAEGELIDFAAADRGLLARFVHDFELYLRGGSDATQHVARVYDSGGSGARDPRTGAVIARYRDALAGRLEPLFEAFRAAQPSQSA